MDCTSVGLSVVFVLDDKRYALDLQAVDKVVLVVDIVALPKAPRIVLGVINFHGTIVPVFNIRERFGLPARDILLTDQLIIARTSKRTVGLLVDSVTGLIEPDENAMAGGGEIPPGTEYVEGIVKLPDGLVFIHNLDTFLSLDEERVLENALECREKDGNSREGSGEEGQRGQ